jgi:hemoglobin
VSATNEGRTQLPVSPARQIRAEDTFFEAVGGEPTFRRLVDTFYAGVATDPLLRPLYPAPPTG